MDFSREELPITSFFARTGNNKKKENLPPTRAAGKRKRDVVEVEADSKLTKNGKEKRAISPKPATSLDRSSLKKQVYGTSRASMSKGKQPSQKDIRSSRPHAPPLPEILDLTTPSPDRKSDPGPSKRRRVEQSALSGHTSAPGIRSHVIGQVFPTPPLTSQSMKNTRKIPMIPTSSTSEFRNQPNATGQLPTPGTSVDRPIIRPRPSHLSKVVFSRTPASPLAARKGVVDIRLLLSSPLSPCPSDEHLLNHDDVIGRSHADVAQALLDVAPRGHDDVGSLSFTQEGNSNGVVDDDPFAAPAAGIIVPPSQPLHLPLPLPSLSHSSLIANTGASTKTSPNFAVPSLPSHVLQSHTTEPRHPATNTNPTSPRAVVESSQSQSLLPSADSPRRMKYLSETVIASSQSQALLPFMNSPRRMERLFSPDAENYGHLIEASQIVGSSQSQIEKELKMSMRPSQIGLFVLPSPAESASQRVHDLDVDNEADATISLPESMLPESIPRTPPNKRASRWRPLHIGSSPSSHNSAASMPSHEDKDIFSDLIIYDDQVGNTTVRPEVGNIRPWRVSRASASRSVPPNHNHLDDSGTESESESDVAKHVVLKQKKHRVPYPAEARTEVEHDLGRFIEKSVVSKPVSHSPPAHAQSYPAPSQLLSEEDTQALYLAGAPLGAEDYSLRTIATDDSTQSMPPAVRDFLDMFDDDGSYPKDFPMELRC